MNRIGIGLIGVGLRGYSFIKALAQSKHAKNTAHIVALSDSDETRLQRGKSLCVSSPDVCIDYHSLIRNPMVDAIIKSSEQRFGRYLEKFRH